MKSSGINKMELAQQIRTAPISNITFKGNSIQVRNINPPAKQGTASKIDSKA